MTGADIFTYSLLAVVCGLFLIGVLVLLIGRIGRFRDELRYVNMEISRTTGRERAHWIRRRRRLWRKFFFFR